MKILLSILVLVILASCGDKNKKTEKNAPSSLNQANSNTLMMSSAQFSNGGVDTGSIPMHALAGVIHANGQVDVPPEDLLAINVPLGGFLKKTSMLPGEPVYRGQVLAIVENPEYITLQQDYLTAKSKIAFLKQEMDRQQVLSTQGASSVKLYQQASSEYNSQLAQSSGLSEKLKLLGIRPQNLTPKNIHASIAILSPIDGYVSKVNVSTGRYINPTDVLMELVNTHDLHATLKIFEQDIAKIRIGTPVTMNLASAPNKIYDGRVILIGKMLDSSHSVLVHCHFLKKDRSLLPNMYLQATLASRSQNTLAVPDEAIITFEGQKYLFMASKKGKTTLMTMVPIDIGIHENGWNAIQLHKTELNHRTFVLKGAFSILSAMKNKGEN